MRRAANIVLIFFLIAGAPLAATMDPLSAMDVGTYAEISARPNPKHYAIQAIPSLAAVLLSVEKKKGRPLTRPEVEALRDKMSVMVVPADAAKEVEAKRGYKDVDQNRAWEEWQRFRTQLQ
ncbi:hypothetical protein [Cupriavidus campinensis]|uniref:hypothetical protein n=1 Tax=Cupriavidus campinensis TaxID=151783 RepID=UPI0011F010AC|nr:hypothetical protein [Cupriavidus campinensis]